MATKAKAPKNKLWLVIYIQLVVIVVGAGAYLFISKAQNSPEAVYLRAMKTIGIGLEEFAASEIINQGGGERYRGYLAISGFSRQDGQEALEPLGLWDPNDPASIACFGQLLETDNRIQLDIDSSFGNPAEDGLLISGQLEADLHINQSPVGGLEARFISGDEPGPIPPVYLMIDKTDCLEHLAAALPEDLLGTWWLIDLTQILGDQLGGDLSSLLDLAGSTAEALTEGESEITQADYDELVEIITSSLKTHIFSDDSERMIFQMTESVDQDAEFGDQTGLYKYDVDLNSANTAAFLNQLIEQIEASQPYQKLVGDPPPTDESTDQDRIDNLLEVIDQFKKNHKIEIWVNPKTKLLRNLRISDIEPTSPNLGSTWDLGLIISDDQEIAISIKTTTFSSNRQCQSTGDGVELSRSDYDQQTDCPYLLGQKLEAVPASDNSRCPAADELFNSDPETISRCLLSSDQETAYIRSLKDNPQPHQIQSFKLTFTPDGQSFGIDYQLSDDNAKISFGIEASDQTGEQTIIAPPDARPIEELFAEISLNPTGLSNPQSNNSRLADVNQIAGGINQFIANRNALPASWSEIEPLLYGLAHYQPDRINAAGAWGDNSVAGEFIELSTVGNLDETQTAGGVKLASDDADSVDYLMVLRHAACDSDQQSLAVGGIREIAIVYKLEGEGIKCLEV